MLYYTDVGVMYIHVRARLCVCACVRASGWLETTFLIVCIAWLDEEMELFKYSLIS